jgi:hypothetical protein
MTCPNCGNELPVDLSPCPVCDPWSAGAATSAHQSTSQSMTAQQFAQRLGISAAAVDIHDLIGAVGGLLLFISFFLSNTSAQGFGASLSDYGGFWGALLPIFAGPATIALFVPRVRAYAGVWLLLSGVAFGIALGGPPFLGGVLRAIGNSVGYDAGFFLAIFGGLGLCYGWLRRVSGWMSPPNP